jgi:hypothetical protein
MPESIMSKIVRKQPLDFRKEDVEYVTQRWSSSASCALVGIGSVGKSNLLQHLVDPDVQRHYMKDKADNFKTIIIDSNMLGPLPAANTADAEQVRCWAGYELMMNRLFLNFYPLDVLGEDAKEFYDAYQMLQDGNNPLYAYLSLRYFELGLEFFMRRGIRIVFMFDEFEEMLRQMPIRFFQTLRGIRDANKSQIVYLTFTRSPLVTVVERLNLPLLDIEPFVELFTDNVRYVGPYNDVDAQAMLTLLASRRPDTAYPSHVLSLLLQATGRYAGMIRAGYNVLEEFSGLDFTDQSAQTFSELLVTRMPIRTECQTVWTSLNRSEQYVLKAVAKLEKYTINRETEQAVTMLMQKRLLRLNKAQQRLEIEPPVFRAYVASNPDLSQ